jgi:hypothetical protein
MILTSIGFTWFEYGSMMCIVSAFINSILVGRGPPRLNTWIELKSLSAFRDKNERGPSRIHVLTCQWTSAGLLGCYLKWAQNILVYTLPLVTARVLSSGTLLYITVEEDHGLTVVIWVYLPRLKHECQMEAQQRCRNVQYVIFANWYMPFSLFTQKNHAHVVIKSYINCAHWKKI